MNDSMADIGIRRLIQNIIRSFRIPENLNHYSREDYANAERQYIKFCLQQGAPADKKLRTGWRTG
jgi:hypothetical protein